MLPDAAGEIYGQGNILGTVSQLAGVPTGAIIERGSNANGEFVKYADGTMICTNVGGNQSLDATTTGDKTASSAFPVTFADKPSVAVAWGGAALNDIDNISFYGVKHGGNAPTTSASQVTFLFRVVTATSFAARVSWVAIGRWF